MREDLYQLAISDSLQNKVEKSIALLQEYSRVPKTLDMFDPNYYGCTSFGKDSVVIMRLCEMAGIKNITWNHSLTTLDPPELIQFGRKSYPNTIIHKPKIPMLRILETVKGPPTRLNRWCCDKYKEQGGLGKCKILGVRATESPRRKASWRQFTAHVKGTIKGGAIVAPILYWTDEDIWQFIHGELIPYCELYDEGWKRLGCIGCPMAGTCGRRREFDRWPKYERAWRRAIKTFVEKWSGVPILRPRWVSMEGKHPFKPIVGEIKERRYVDKTERVEEGFITYRRWFDLQGCNDPDSLWRWWMQNEDEPSGCTMGMF